jgi:ABC-2 type transport system permease protein
VSEAARSIADAATRRSTWSASWSLAERELVRFFRQRNRVVGALGQPIIFWVLFGAGLRGSFQPAGAASGMLYGEYFFPGVVVMIVLFTAIFSTISIIEDRKEGFLQGVLVAPVPRPFVVLGKVAGGTALAMLQAWFFLLLAPLAGVPLSAMSALATSLLLIVVGLALTSLGVAIAWRMDSTQGFHAIMSVFLLPMWLLSGSFFPEQGAPTWLAWTIRLNPLTYGVASVRRLLYLGDPSGRGVEGLPSLPVSLLVTIVFAAAMFALACRVAQRDEGAGR